MVSRRNYHLSYTTASDVHIGIMYGEAIDEALERNKAVHEAEHADVDSLFHKIVLV